MFHVIRIALVLLVCTFFSATALSPVQAAPQETMKIKAEIGDKNFWDYNFITDSILSKASIVKLEWSFGNTGSNQKEENILSVGKNLGQVAITSTRGEPVNIKFFVKNAKNDTLGSWSLQITNKGQTETITIFLPEKVQPEFGRATQY